MEYHKVQWIDSIRIDSITYKSNLADVLNYKEVDTFQIKPSGLFKNGKPFLINDKVDSNYIYEETGPFAEGFIISYRGTTSIKIKDSLYESVYKFHVDDYSACGTARINYYDKDLILIKMEYYSGVNGIYERN